MGFGFQFCILSFVFVLTLFFIVLLQELFRSASTNASSLISVYCLVKTRICVLSREI